MSTISREETLDKFGDWLRSMLDKEEEGTQAYITYSNALLAMERTLGRIPEEDGFRLVGPGRGEP